MNFTMRKSLMGVCLGLLLGCTEQTSEQHMQAARDYAAQQDNAAAIVSLKNAVQLEPRSGEARFELGRLYLAENQFESAEKELNRAIEYGYDATVVLPLLTRAYQQTGAYAALSEVEHDQKGLTPEEQAEIGYFKVVSLVRLNKLIKARTLIDELSGMDTDSVFTGLTTVYADVLDKNYSAALEQVEALRQQAPDNPELLKLAAQLHLSVGDAQAAADEFDHYVKLYPEDLQTTFVLAKLLVDLGKTSQAEPYIDQLLVINNANPLLNQLKAAVRGAEKDYPNAQHYAETAIQNGLTEPSLRLIAGYAAYQQQDYAAAQQHLSFIASSLPDNHPGLRLLAASQLQLGLPEQASDVLGRIEQISEQDAPLFSKASYELLRSGYVKDAEQMVEKSSKISTTAEDLTRLGLLQLSLNNLEGIINLEEALDKSPQLASAKTTLATAYLGTKQFDKALELANDWKQTNPEDVSAYLLAGEVYSQQKDFPKATEEFKQAQKIDPQHQGAGLALVNLTIAQGMDKQAQEQLKILISAHPTYVPALATNYMLTKKVGDSASGISAIESAQQANKDNLELQMLLARIYLLEGRYKDGLEQLAAFDQLESKPDGYWPAKGQALLRSNQRDAAHTHYDKWLALAPNSKEAVIGKLLLLDNESKFEQAQQLTQAFLKKRDDLQMQLLNTHFLLMSKDYQRGRAAYNELPENLKALPLAKGFLARLQLLDKQLPEALENAKVAYQSVPNSRNLVLQVFIMEKLGEKDNALALIEQHVSKQPKDSAALMLLAERQISQGSNSAMQTYEDIIAQSPNNFVAHNNLAYLYLQKKDIQLAKTHASKAVKLQPENAAAVDTLAQVLIAAKDYNEAVKYYESVVDDKMQNEEIYLNYVEALFLADNKVLAKRKLTQRSLQGQDAQNRLTELKAKYTPE